MGGIVTPDDIAERLREWVERIDPSVAEFLHVTRRVELVENEGPRRTWTLYEGPTQVGHVRAVCGVALEYERGLMLREWLGEPECGDARERLARLQARAPWTVETSRGIAREALGLDEPPRSGQTDPG